MSQNSLKYEHLYQEDSSHICVISTQVACNAACVQEKRSRKHEREMCVCVCNQMWVWVCECVSVIINQSSIGLLLVCVYNESAPKNVIRSAPLDACVCMCTRKKKGGTGVCVCLSSSLSRRHLLVCVCMLTSLNACDYIRQLLYIVLKIISYSHITTPCNLLNT